MAPVAQSVKVSHEKTWLKATRDVGQAPSDFAGDKSLAAPWALVVKKDAVAGVESVGLSVVDRDPVGVQLSYGVGASRVEGRGLSLGGFLHQAVELGSGGLVEAGLFAEPQNSNCLKKPERSKSVNVCRVLGAIEAYGHVRLRAQVVDLIGLSFLHDADEVAGVAKVSEVQLKARVLDMRVFVDVVNSLGVKKAGASLDAVDDVTFFK